MDPFSLLAGSAGIATLCVKISAALYTFIDDAKSVDRNVRDLLDEIKALSRVAEAISQSWTRNALVDAAQVESGGDLWGSVQDTLEDCRSALKRLGEVLKDVEKRGFLPRNFLRTIRLNLKMRDILLFKQQFHTYNSAMQSALQMINTCLLISSSSSQDSIQRVLLSLKIQIERIEGNVNERPNLPLSPQESAERERVAKNLSRLTRMATNFHTSASTIIEGDRSTVWGGSVLGDPLTQEHYGRIHNWIPTALEGAEELGYAHNFSSVPDESTQHDYLDHLLSSPAYLNPSGTPGSSQPSHSPAPPYVGDFIPPMASRISENTPNSPRYSGFPEDPIVYGMPQIDLGMYAGPTQQPVYPPQWSRGRPSDSSDGVTEANMKLLAMEDLMKKAQVELVVRGARESAFKAELEAARKTIEERALREKMLEEEKKAWASGFWPTNDTKFAAAQGTVSEEANPITTESSPESDSESGSDVERDLMNRFKTLGTSEYQEGNFDIAEMYLRKAVTRETKRQSQTISATRSLLICCCMRAHNWNEAESFLLPLAMSKKLHDPLAYLCLYVLSVWKGSEGDWHTALRYCQQSVWGIRRVKMYGKMPYQVALRFLSHAHGVLGHPEEKTAILSFMDTEYLANNVLNPQVALQNVLGLDGPKPDALAVDKKVESITARVVELTKVVAKETVTTPKVETTTLVTVPPPAWGPGATAIYSYMAADDRELSFDENGVITDLVPQDEEWWYGTYNGRRGLFPAHYVVFDHSI